MEVKQWKYRIETGKLPVFLSLGMLALFGSLSYWLHTGQNSAYIFCDILTVIMFAVLLLTVYRLFFYKILIGRFGFYYQTQISNGRYYSYGELRKAWISSGKNHSGHQTEYCNIETPDGRVIRFIFYYSDAKGVEYMVRQIEAMESKYDIENADRAHEYRIDGKTQGRTGLVISIVVVAMICLLAIPELVLGGIYILPGIAGILMAVYILFASIFRYFCYQIKIGEQGFYYQTTPFNSAYFRYQDITHCWEVLKVYRYYRSADRSYHYHFYFTDKSGKTQRFQFSKDMHEREVDVLKQRIGCNEKESKV